MLTRSVDDAALLASVRDFAAVSLLGAGPNVVVTHPSVAARTIPDLIALAKAQPGRMTMGSPGAGSTNHLAGELFQKLGKGNSTLGKVFAVRVHGLAEQGDLPDARLGERADFAEDLLR